MNAPVIVKHYLNVCNALCRNYLLILFLCPTYLNVHFKSVTVNYDIIHFHLNFDKFKVIKCVFIFTTHSCHRLVFQAVCIDLMNLLIDF